MAFPTAVPAAESSVAGRLFGRARLIYLLVLVALLVVCMALSWVTRDAMQNLPFLAVKGTASTLAAKQKALVDVSPWQTAQALAPLAVSAEEHEFAHDAERLADHEVDQAFASALRVAGLQAQHRVLTGDALALSQKVTQLQQLIKDDQALVQSLTPASTPQTGTAKSNGEPAAGGDDLEVAKAQLGLDTDEMADAQRDLERASGDQSAEIQAELAAHEATMRKYDSQVQDDGQTAVLSRANTGPLLRG